MNRILMHLGKGCACSRVREHVERLSEAARDIEAVTGELVEIAVPSAQSIIDGRRGVTAFIAWESTELLPDNLAADVADELLALADSLKLAAEALTAGGAL